MTAPNETWKAIPGYESRYQVSDLGRVRSINFWDGRRQVTGRVLRPGAMNSGRVSVALGRGNSRMVHALVMLAFVGPYPPGLEILHGNSQPSDNRLTNLAYGTRSANIKMDYALGTRVPARVKGSAHGLSKLNNQAVRHIRCSLLSSKDLGALYGVTYTTIDSAKLRKTWKHVV